VDTNKCKYAVIKEDPGENRDQVTYFIKSYNDEEELKDYTVLFKENSMEKAQDKLEEYILKGIFNGYL
jgi:hypothetical protein